jgi:hypothetical protein
VLKLQKVPGTTNQTLIVAFTKRFPGQSYATPPHGHLCGYIGVPKESLPPGAEEEFEAHGGITFNEKGDDNDLYWLGFDCSTFR